MYTCTVISTWVGAGTRANPYRPRFSDDYPTCNWDWVSGDHTDPTCTIDATVPDQMTADALGADANYSTSNWHLVTGGA